MKIEMARGDRVFKRIVIIPKSELTVDELEFDEIYFTCKKNEYVDDYIFQKKLSDGTITKDDQESNVYHVVIEPEDTDGLWYNNYAFDIELIMGDTLKQTFTGTLTLTKEVTFPVNEN